MVRAFGFPLVLALVVLAGCRSNEEIIGFGAKASDAERDADGTRLEGDDVGAGVGHVIGDDVDRARAADMPRDHTEDGPLAGTRWRLISFESPRVDDPPGPDEIIEFRPDNTIVTVMTSADGSTTTTAEEYYRVVDDTLIINRPGFLLNAKFRIEGSQLIVEGRRYRAVLERQ